MAFSFNADTTRSNASGAARLGLVDENTAPPALAGAFAKLPVINVFRAMANATSLYPAFADFLLLLFKPLELDAALERMIVLRVSKLSNCYYAWRQNVVVGHSVGVTDEQIEALDRGDVVTACFSAAQQAAFAFADEAVFMVEVSDATYTRAKRFFSDRALTEMLYVIGVYMLVARVVRTGHVPLDEHTAPSPQ